MTPATFELRELKPARMVNFKGNSINLNNIVKKTISTSLLGRKTITLKLRSGEILTYEATDKELDVLFQR